MSDRNQEMREMLAEHLRLQNLRNTPDIRFYLDRSIAYGVDMSHKIDQVIESDNSKHHEDQ